MANQWFKFYGAEYLSDPKMDRLSAQERSCWLTLLCMASQSNGIVKFLSVEGLLNKSGIRFDPYDTSEWDSVQGILKTFEQYEMVTVHENGNVEINNWEKRQEHNLTVAERVAKSRANKKNVTTNVTNVTSEENRIEKNRIEKKRVNTTAELEKAFFENPLMSEIQKEYPDRNYKLQFSLMADWWITHKKKLPQNISAFTNWLKNTKPDEAIQNKRLREIANDEQRKKEIEIINTPRASDEKLKALRIKMATIGKGI